MRNARLLAAELYYALFDGLGLRDLDHLDGLAGIDRAAEPHPRRQILHVHPRHAMSLGAAGRVGLWPVPA